MSGSKRPTNLSFFQSQDDANLVDGDTPGGYVAVFKGEAALNIGDIVFLSAAHTVNKSDDVADYVAVIGVVVGGYATNMEVLQDDIDVGEAACAAGEPVLVGVLGKFKVVSDEALTLGNKITSGGTTAGRAAVADITTDLVAGNSGSIVGTVLETTTGAAEVVLALINVH